MIRKIFTESVPFTDPGSRVAPVLSSIVHDDGTFDIITTGSYDLQDYIDSFAESCSLKAAFERFAAGDYNAFNVNSPGYGDFTSMPKTYAEFLQKDLDGRKLFDSLSPDVRAKFGNDYRQFVAESTNEDFALKAGFVSPVVEELPIIDKPVKEVVS